MPPRCAASSFCRRRKSTDRGRAWLRLEPQIDVQHLQETPQQQPRAHQQHAGQRNLGDDQHRPHASCRRPALIPCPLSFSASCKLPAAMRSAGASPNSAAATTAISSVQATAAPSTRTLPAAAARSIPDAPDRP